MDKMIEKFGKEKIEEIVKKSNSFVEVSKKLGLEQKDSLTKYLYRTIKRLDISTDHFESIKKNKDCHLKYNKEILEKLISEDKNFKEMLLELDVVPMGNNYKTLKKYLKLYNIDFSHLKMDKNFIRTHWDKEILSEIVKNSTTQKDVLKNMGLRAAGSNFGTLRKYLDLYKLDISHFVKNYEEMVNRMKINKINLCNVLIENSTYNRGHLKERLYNEGFKEKKCEICGQGEEWYGRHMSLILDHINGIYNDNRLENLRIVCPNCNATLEIHCGKNTKEKIKMEKEQKEKNIMNAHISRRKVERPDFEILKEEIGKFGLEGVGRKYGVSGNAIKKWVKTYQKYNI